MHCIILCGGSGERMQGYSLPKPLNMIWAKPAIYYTLYHLPKDVTDIHFIMSTHLDEYNFEPTVRNQFRSRKCHFYRLPYFTRGPIESAVLGVLSILKENPSFSTDGSAVFLDNDVYYNFPQNFFTNPQENFFLGYCKDTSGSEAYSFVKIEEHTIIDIQEKRRISDLFCCGVYGFPSLQSFLNIAKGFLAQHHEQEYYMSCLFQQLIAQKHKVVGVAFTNVCHLGSLAEVQNSIHSVPIPKLRICFDLDNTLVTYPYIVGDYSSVRPNQPMVTLAQNLHHAGHTIIIYTARRMETHKNNVGAVIKDIAKVTIDILEKFDIPYDELIFGKPLADIYIDDRAVNPFRNDFASMGLLMHESSSEPVNKLPNNKYNKVVVQGKDVIKTGPKEVLRGEIAFYQSIPEESACVNMFPRYRGATISDEATLRIEYVKGIPLYHLYRAELLTEDVVRGLFGYLDVLHNVTTPQPLPTLEQVQNNYVSKLRRRFAQADDYPFDKEEVQRIQKACMDQTVKYCCDEKLQSNIRSMIHGDFWFSNIILEFKKQIRAIDMKGHLDGVITTGGDALYDYAKLYQSFLGYDLALYGDSCSQEYRTRLCDVFEEECAKRHIDVVQLKSITFGLVMGTLHAIEECDKKMRVWKWIVETFSNN